MTQQIIAHGHRHVVYFGARRDRRTIIKQQGYEQAMRESGLEPYSIMTARSSSYSAGGSCCAGRSVDYPQIDGIFCTNDDWRSARPLNASGRGCRSRGMAIAGFHGHDIGGVMVPKPPSPAC